MKKIILLSNALIMLLLISAAVSFATSPASSGPLSIRNVLAADTGVSQEFQNLENQNEPVIGDLAQTFYIYLSRLVLLVSILAGVIGGYMYMTSSGDPKKIQTAKDIIYSALLGVLAVAFAYTFFNVILPKTS